MKNIERIQGNFLCIDPGTIGTGWAFFTPRSMLPKHGVVYGKNHGLERNERVAGICREIRGVIVALRPQWVVIEEPGFWGPSATSYASAVKGDIFSVAFVVGGLLCAAVDCECNVMLVSPQQWKGQLAKKAVQLRIRRAFGENAPVYRDHEADAVGMGLSIKGVL